MHQTGVAGLTLGAQASRLLLVPRGRKSIDREFIPWIPDQRPYPWGSHEPTAELANFDGKVGRTTPVGSYPAGAGPFGTQDQAGPPAPP